jgi:hypothetical protein
MNAIGEIEGKPLCNLVGINGSVFSLMGRVNRTLREAGKIDQARELLARADGQTYAGVLALIREYVEIEQ